MDRRGEAALRRFHGDADGATAVEFALVAIPFLALLFAIIEVGLLFFADNSLDYATNNAARLIRTGQAQTQNFSAAAFKTTICTQLTPLLACDGLQLDVRPIANFAAAADPIPKKKDGTLDPANFSYDMGKAGQIVLVRTYYEWPLILNIFGNSLANLADGKRLISATVALKIEPYK